MAEEIDIRRYCFGCGELNPAGLRLEFRYEGNKAVAEFLPEERYQGYAGLVHGGIAATALDEAMGWAMRPLGVWSVTGKMEVRYRQPLPLHQKAVVSGEVIRNRGRWLEVRGEIRSEQGKLMVESYGLFMRLPEAKVRELEKIYGVDTF
ncbi:MAG: PaaI family thioesterase [Dehalococcoidia bacterium]